MPNPPWLDLSQPEAAKLDWRQLAAALSDVPALAEQAAHLVDPPSDPAAEPIDQAAELTDAVLSWLRQTDFLVHWQQTAAAASRGDFVKHCATLAQRCREQSQKLTASVKQSGGAKAGIVGRLAGLGQSYVSEVEMSGLAELLQHCELALTQAAKLAANLASRNSSVTRLWQQFAAAVPPNAYPPLQLLRLQNGLVSRLLRVDPADLRKLASDILAHAQAHKLPKSLQPTLLLIQVLLVAREPTSGDPPPAELCQFLSLPTLTELPTPPPLAKLRTVLLEVVWASETGRNPLAEARAELAAWLDSPAGEDWLHRLAMSALSAVSADPTVASAEDTPTAERDTARLWLQYLLEHRFVQIYPSINTSNWSVTWPAGVAEEPGVTYEFSDVPAGQLVRVERYAHTPQQAGCTISLGPERHDSPLPIARQLLETCTHTHWLAAQLLAPAEALVAATMYLELARQPAKPVQTLLLEALDGLVRAIESAIEREPDSEPGNLTYLAPDDAPILRQAHAILCELAGRLGFTVLPEVVVFGDNATATDAPSETIRTDLPEEAIKRTYYYREAPLGQLVRVRQFGLLAKPSGKVLRPASLIISAGPMPMGFERLCQLVDEQPGSEPLQQQLHDWPMASVESRLEEAATQLFVDYWGEPGQQFRKQAPAASEDFAQVLASLLEVFGMQTFSPIYYQDVPNGWARLNSERRMASGRVMAVLRPGLQDHRGNLLVPAIIEVD